MRTSVRPSVTFSIVFAAFAFVPGCATSAQSPTATPAGARPARIELVNLSDCDWSVAVTMPDGGNARTTRLPARETLRLELPGGDYQITQTALTGLTGADATRRFPAHLESGESYRWRLATLLTGQTGGAP